MVRGNRQKTLGMLVLAQLGALMFVLKMALAAFPNVEPVSLLVMVYTVTLGKWALVPIYIYVLMENLIWGISEWSICYIYVWLILWGLARLMRKMDSPIGWAVLSGGFGLCFGALCAPVYIAIGGWAYALSWWVSGIPMDLVHCTGNFAFALILFKPLRTLLDKLLTKAGLLPTRTPAPLAAASK